MALKPPSRKPMATPWDKPKKEASISQDIRDTREWLMVTYGGRWGRLQLAGDRAEKLEVRLVAQDREIRRLTTLNDIMEKQKA